MINLILTIVLFFSTFKIYAGCDFNTGRYLKELNNPKSIENIKIEVLKFRKFIKNYYRIILSKTKNIPPKFRKKFNAKVIVNYNFGTCSFKARVWQNGDWKDHIGIINGKPIRSLNVKLEYGNILNSVKFKLLIPSTRNDLSEVLATVILRELGFISPETFKVYVTLNGVNSQMLFQEDSRKEMLERNKRREGPIFEGDETLVWSSNGREKSKDNISLARFVNKKWFLKGNESAFISLRAMQRIQNAYLINTNNTTLSYYIQPNINNKQLFDDYNLFLLAMGGTHGLILHNRKYYYNSFTDDFEPIYYDGDIKIEKNYFGWQGLNHPVVRFSLRENSKIPKLDLILSESFEKKITSEFKKRITENSNRTDKFVVTKLNTFKHNISKINDLITPKFEYLNFNDFISSDSKNYISKVAKKKLDQEMITDIYLKNNEYYLTHYNGTTSKVNNKKVIKILSDLKLNNKRTIFLSNNKNFDSLNNYLINDFPTLKGKIYRSRGTSLSYSNNLNTITINQKYSSDWILFSDFDFSDGTKIIFNGKKKKEKELNSQRFNKFGLTGCLNIYNSNFVNTKFDLKNGGCEDSINIVNSSGTIDYISVNNAFSDGVDIDFSDLNIINLAINSSNNDCFDVSGGTYFLNTVDLKNCNDKGISVGEKSELDAKHVRILNSAIGISSKDFSKTIVNYLEATSQVCYEAMQKKQEFGGAYLQINNLRCKGDRNVDSNSIAIIK